MGFNKEHARQLLKNFSFKELFVEELGWDHYKARPISLKIDNENFTLSGLVEKRGMTVFECSPDATGHIPQSPIRRKIENQIRKTAAEHIIIYTDSRKSHQKWQWIRREASRPIASREHDFTVSQPGEALLQKLAHLEITVDEESDLTIFGVTTRARAAFDVDKVTKKFFERFKQEHAAFLKFIKGIESQGDREWYASLMLNRLMFCYFIQKKGFLDGDTEYLRNRLNTLQDKKGKDKFFSFYRHFLLRLFHEGLGKREHSHELDALIGKVPYLNGGFFDLHKLETQNPSIDIRDEAFEKVFDFFDGYHWHLDERPLRDDKEINPDVLGYIFEKYINQKQMGAYYTKEDITGYIGKNTIIPWLLDATKKKCEIAFRPDSAMWRLFKDDPDRYLYPAMRKGVIAEQADVASGIAHEAGAIIQLPKEIEAGVAAVAERKNWNSACDDHYALPTEIWREHVARRQRCLDVRKKMTDGDIHETNDLVTYNLDIAQFAEDTISKCEGPEFLRAMYENITGISVLDPTCGSGAFLFAGLNILEELYDACINRMEVFVADTDLAEPGNKKFKDFRAILDQMAKHPSRKYFIYKSIIINNLFGVDIMEEAVEICKLRLFLKLVAQVEKGEQIEPLPDIDFNIRAGNTLVGFATYEELKRSQEGQMDLYGDFAKLDEQAELVSMAYDRYKSGQLTDAGTKELQASKKDLETRLSGLNERLSEYLARQYGVDKYEDIGGNNGLFPKPGTLKQTTKKYDKWLASHQPFHWFAEFYRIMHKGGFDVVIGNPPWKEYSAVCQTYKVKGYVTEPCGNLHNLCTERALTIVRSQGRFSFIVQLPLVSSGRMQETRDLLRANASLLTVVPFDDRPGKLFEGLQHCRATIFCIQRNSNKDSEMRWFAGYQRWATESRSFLMHSISYSTNASSSIFSGIYPKVASVRHADVIGKMAASTNKSFVSFLSTSASKYFVFYQEAMQYWAKAAYGLPYYSRNGSVGAPAHGRYIFFDSEAAACVGLALLNSSLFYSYFVTFSDCFHLGETMVSALPIPPAVIGDKGLARLGKNLDKDLRTNASRKTIATKSNDTISYDEFVVGKSKPIIDQIDTLLAQHYGFTPEELDYIINYDIKYRMGGELDSGEEDS
jgi:hypothetical protein